MRFFAGKSWDEEDHEWRVYYGNGCACIARALMAAWQEIHYNHGEIPNIQQGKFFANAIALEGRHGSQGPTGDTVRTHSSICEELEKVGNQPVSSIDSHTWVEHSYGMRPVYRSIIIIIDKQPASRRGEDEAELRDILFEQCSVLLVRTQDEHRLSAPIDLSILTMAGLTLPLDRSKRINLESGQQVVRVRLRTAVRFVMDLDRRERNSSARLIPLKRVLDADTSGEAEKWAAAVLTHAESNGSIDHNFDSWEAVRLAQAHLDGDSCGLTGLPLPIQEMSSVRYL